MTKVKFIIQPNGDIEFIYKDELRPLMKLGRTEIRRASSVEPMGNKWLVDLSPIGGPKLGPFSKREEALRKEVKWIEKNYLKVK